MKHLLIAIRVYWVVIAVWAVTSVFGLLPEPIAVGLKILTWPIWGPLGFLTIGVFWLGPVVMLLLLWALDQWLCNRLNGARGGKEAGPQAGLVPDN